MALPTPDRSALAVLPTNTPTLPTPRLKETLAPRPSDTATPTATVTPTPSRTPTLTPTATRTPTVTSTPRPGPIASALGFSDPAIARFDADGYSLADRQTVRLGRNRIVAAIVEPPIVEGEAVVGDQVPRLLVYRIQTGQPPRLLFEDEGSDQTIEFAGLGYTWEEPLGWGDINGDDLLELPIWAANGGFCYACTRLYILQLNTEQATPTGANRDTDSAMVVRELTGAVPALNLITNPLIPRWLTDFDGDATPDIAVLDGRFEHGFGLSLPASPELMRVYTWDGKEYSDVTRLYPGYLLDQAGRAKSAVESTYGQPLSDQDTIGRTVTVLLAYELVGLRDEGWTLFWQLSDPANWNGEASAGLLDWISRVREYLKGQYDSGEAFTPWPPTTPGGFQPSAVDIQATIEPETVATPPPDVAPTVAPSAIPPSDVIATETAVPEPPQPEPTPTVAETTPPEPAPTADG